VAIATREAPAPGRAARPTGVGRYCGDLAEGLRALGHEVHLVGVGAAAGVRGWLRARREAAALQPECLVLGEPGWLPAAALARPHPPYLPVFYGTEAVALRRALAYRGIAPHRRVRRRLLADLLGGAERLVCISRYAAAELRRTAGAVEPAIVHPAVSRAFTEPAPAPEPGGAELRVVTIGRVSERKNQLGTLRALARLAREHAVQFLYIMAGQVDRSVHAPYAEAVRRFAAEQGLGGSVRELPGASDAELAALLDGCHVCVALSRPAGVSVEGFGITALEAAARARATLVAAHGGLPEAVEHEVTGLVVDADDEAAVATALLSLWRDPALRRRMGEAGRRRALERFTPLRMAEAFEAALR
jgi:glycosyltransferase involved in cell wall biosynthesis